MCSLLSLPRELRDQIIEYVILSHKIPPQDPSQCLESRLDSSNTGTLRPPAPSHKTYNASALLGANVQLRNETQNRLRHIKPSYSLDVMVNDHDLWPTWTCCPARTTGPIEEIHVSFRFFSKPNDPFMVHVARTLGAVLQGRKWSGSLHPLAELFLHIRDVCLRPGDKEANVINLLCFDVCTMNRLDHVVALVPALRQFSTVGLKSLFGKHRSLWNSFRSIFQYPFAGEETTKTLEAAASLRIMIILFLQEAWEDDCAVYTSYVGPLGMAFRSVQSLKFLADGQDLGQFTSRILPG
ncbi:hypothetical protein E8E13_004234 [Curvularia kusanoi]|uniref:Uncharacterized protein n=1 Tax=Curvularia kusanoi TaxID=90978 RepID=A0A9P4T5I0_CURKU|nr:hypothetical protein E8E13_004234 [Curvularia kusanoi]